MSAPTLEISQSLLNSHLVKGLKNEPEYPDSHWDEICKGSTRSNSGRNPNYLRGFAHGPFGALRRLRTDGQRSISFATRRKRGGDGRLPHDIRCEYTEGQRAVLSVIGEQVAKTGRCLFPVERIAALAGVGIRTVQYAISRAQTLGHLSVTYRPRRGQRSLTNVVTVKANEWLAWLRPKAKAPTDIGCKAVHTEENNNNKTLFSSQNETLNKAKDRNGLGKGNGGEARPPKNLLNEGQGNRNECEEAKSCQTRE